MRNVENLRIETIRRAQLVPVVMVSILLTVNPALASATEADANRLAVSARQTFDAAKAEPDIRARIGLLKNVQEKLQRIVRDHAGSSLAVRVLDDEPVAGVKASVVDEMLGTSELQFRLLDAGEQFGVVDSENPRLHQTLPEQSVAVARTRIEEAASSISHLEAKSFLALSRQLLASEPMRKGSIFSHAQRTENNRRFAKHWIEEGSPNHSKLLQWYLDKFAGNWIMMEMLYVAMDIRLTRLLRD